MAVGASYTEVCEAILIDLAEKAGVDPRDIRRALKISRATYYRRRRLPAAALARRDVEHDLDEAACR